MIRLIGLREPRLSQLRMVSSDVIVFHSTEPARRHCQKSASGHEYAFGRLRSDG